MVKSSQNIKNLQIGDQAPNFTVLIDNDKHFSLLPLVQNVVLYFYPKDDTPGCTIEAKDFADRLNDFANNDTIIIGVSRDNIDSHRAFQEKYCLPFTLGSDPDHLVCELYGVWIEKSMFGKKYMGIDRATFLISKDGVIKNIWRGVKADGHAKAVLAEVVKLSAV